MVSLLDRKKKKIKLRDIYIKFAKESSIFRGKAFFNFQKYRRRKWNYYRKWFLYKDDLLLKRYSPNLTYIPNYSQLVTNENIKAQDIKVDLFGQLLSYQSRLNLKRKIGNYFYVRNYKKLRKMFVFRHMSTHFNVFDSNYAMFLVRLGLANNMKEACHYIKNGILSINGYVQKNVKHFNNFDIIHFSRTYFRPRVISCFFSKKKKRWNFIRSKFKVRMFDFLSFLTLQKIEDKNFLGILPFTYPANFSNFSFFYFNKLLKNQWHFFWDFHIAKKFLHYNR